MKNSKILIVLSIVLSTMVYLVSCNKNDDSEIVDSNEDNESITKITLFVTQDNKTSTYSFEEGKKSPTIILDKSINEAIVEVKFYNGVNEINPEIIEEKDAHFLAYSFLNSSISYTREDDSSLTRADGNKLGLKTKWKINVTTQTANQLNLKLIHEPTKINSDGTYEGGSTDADQTVLISFK